jgi:general secretion pathway protein M
VLAVALLLIALLGSYLLFVHWWFTSPLMLARAELIELREQESDFRHSALQRPAIEQRLAEVREFEAANPGFLPEDNFDLAASALIQRLRTQVDGLGAGTDCQLVSTTPVRSREEEPFVRVGIQVRMRCETERLLPALHALESGSPQLFIGDFGVFTRRVSASIAAMAAQRGAVDVNFELYGYLRQRGEAQ